MGYCDVRRLGLGIFEKNHCNFQRKTDDWLGFRKTTTGLCKIYDQK